jgi:lipopolysaccharide exporter
MGLRQRQALAEPCPHAESRTRFVGPQVVTAVGRKVAVGALWMVGLRLLERAIGFVSTLILARLLVPADFGLVAMAMTVYAFVEVAGNFGFDLALLRDKDASREAYDSAWTLYVMYGVFAFLLLLALAWPAAQFHGDPRLVPVMAVLGLIALVQGFDNIGTVHFRKEFRFDAEFKLMLYRKLVAFAVTVSLAVAFRNYWALIGGMVAQRATGTVLSYTMHPYRPRFNLTHARALFGFSRWLVLARLMECLKNRGPDFMIGRHLDLAALGLHRLSLELATLATSELMLPILRAVFPGYAAVAHDRQALASSFLRVQGSIVLVTLPVGLCFVLMPDLVVRALLGTNWLGATPLVMIFGLSGCLSMFQLTSLAIFEVLGQPQRSMWLRLTENVLLLPSVAIALWSDAGLIGAAWCWVGVQILLVPLSAWLIHGLLPLTLLQRLSVLWRPALGAVLMAVVIHAVRPWLPAVESSVAAFAQLLGLAALAVVGFAAMVFGAWWAAGRPSGPESSLVEWILSKSRPTEAPPVEPHSST